MQRSVRRAAMLTRGVDPWLMLAFLGLVCVGILMVYSSSIADAYTYYGSPYFYVERELVWVGLGIGALAVAVKTSYREWDRLALPLFAAALALLVLVMVPGIGHASHGARRWLSLTSFFVLEPSELMKLALVVYMASWLASKGERVRDFKSCFGPFSLIVGLIALLIVKQPDLGTTMVVVATAIAIVFVAGAHLTHLASVCAGGGAAAYMLMHGQGYQRDRLLAFLNPWNDPNGFGYHPIQALLALRFGGLFGQGLGNSSQKYVLPAPHTDSILAIIGEELGLIGTMAVLVLFLVIAYRGIRIAAGAPDTFGRLLAAGVTSWIIFQALMNFAVITSSVPFTGVPLPFVSYGGTSLVISMIAMGILLNISRHVSGESFARQDLADGWRDRRTSVPRVIHRPAPHRRAGSAARGSASSQPAPSRSGVLPIGKRNVRPRHANSRQPVSTARKPAIR